MKVENIKLHFQPLRIISQPEIAAFHTQIHRPQPIPYPLTRPSLDNERTSDWKRRPRRSPARSQCEAINYVRRPAGGAIVVFPDDVVRIRNRLSFIVSRTAAVFQLFPLPPDARFIKAQVVATVIFTRRVFSTEARLISCRVRERLNYGFFGTRLRNGGSCKECH